MQDFSFGITQIALYFTQQCNCCDNRHILEHHFFPFFMIPFRLPCNTRIQIIINNLSPNRIGNHRRDKVTVLLQCRSEFFTLSRTRRKHNIRSGLQIILMYNIIDIAILSVCLTHNTQFQLIEIFIERLRTVFHFCRLTIPSSGLFGIGLIKCRKFIIQSLILYRRILCRPHQSLIYLLKPVQHIGRYVQCQHGCEDDIHQVYHLLPGREI